MGRRGVVRAGVFGSVARGEDTPERDLDVATPASLHPRLRDQILAEVEPFL